ncbi:MAG TPA: ABC transporter permease [Gemmatimonadaceae bacterium]|nr:ABC transporter permease [Gemmatimonadaceae bacterium]
MLTKDLAFALRTLRNHPGFTATAVITIALGIGASTAIFSVVNAVLLRPLPYANPERLAVIRTDMRARNVIDFPIAPGNMPDLLQRATAFEHIAGINAGTGSFIGDDGKPEQINVAGVTSNFFTVLGTRIAFGRNFTPGDATPPPPPPPAVPGQPAAPPNPANQLPAMTILSHSFWERKFGGDSSVIGKTVQLFNGPATIVGVAEPGLRIVFPAGTGPTAEPDAYTALRIDWSTASRINVFLRVIGRLKPGVSLAAAQAQLDNLGADLQGRFPIFKTSNTVWYTQPMASDIVKDVRPALLALMGAVIFVLLIACANVANLLLVRMSARERELAIRSALGGTRNALVGQMLAESFVLAAGGAVVGLILAKLGIELLLRIVPPNLPRVGDVSIDPSVLVFAAAMALASALVFGILPALRASRPNLSQTLRSGGRSPGLHAGRYLRQGVVVAEVGLSFVLLVGAGLMLRSFMALERVDPGFEPTGVLTFTAPNGRLRSPDERHAYANQLAERLRALPGVTDVTAAGPLPLDGVDQNARWGTIEARTDPSRFQQATLFAVRPGYFTAMRVRMIAGRSFTEADNVRQNTGIIVDDQLAAKAFPGQSPASIIGKSLLVRINSPEAQEYQIIGVAAHERHLTLATAGREGILVPEGQLNFGSAFRWAVRTNGDPSRLMPQVRRVVAEVDPLVAIGDLKPMSDYFDRAMAPTRFSLVLIGIFGAVAAVLAGVGLYGVLSTTVRQRTAEIGVRMAFGASSDSIFRLMIGHGLVLSAVGIGVGLVAALALTGLMQRASMLIAIAPTDPVTYAAIAMLFAAVAALACWLPARRAAALDPNVALREE